MSKIDVLAGDGAPRPAWELELRDIQAERRSALDAKGIAYSMAADGAVPIGRLLAFAKAVRAQPDVWGRCVVEAERRKSEVSDPNSELRQNGEVREDTSPENFLLEWGRFVNFKNWFMLKMGYFDTDSGLVYLGVSFILRKWNRGEISEDDEKSFVTWFRKYQSTGIIFDSEQS